ncbi:meiosis inhibitor protein 1 isoform X2 [Brachyhypopomus gauderio]|uniref:meiosis inhibitor protein 1 isoform X2 n=1 Tax=Brachyhypopomus gauderio TaxID=698409 RepID=UPI004040F704
MWTVDITLEKVHLRHHPRWSARAPRGLGATVCVACVIEMMDRQDVSAVRRSVALTGVGELLKTAGVMREILDQDERVCLHLTSSLLKLLQSVGEPAILEQAMQVLVELLLEMKKEKLVECVLLELQTQLCEQAAVRRFLPSLTFLGKLMDVIPDVALVLTTVHSCLLEAVCACLLNPDEDLKTAVCYVLRGVWASDAVQSVSHTLRERVCVLSLQTLTHASSHQLTINSLGLLLLLLRSSENVSLLMNQTHSEKEEDEEEESQCTQITLQHCSLPLILKKLLLSGDESLQVVSVQCVSAVLVHSPSQYCAPFIQADIPEFLFECVSSRREVMLWCVYGCLLLLCEDSVFFTHCHSVYGIESLLRSLKAVLKLSNVEVQTQGLRLLTAILDRQPVGVRLFPTGPGFVGVAEVVVGGVASSCLQVATQGTCAATALLRIHHQSSPVHYSELKRIVETVAARCTERCFYGSGVQSSEARVFLIQALVCIQEACRLAEVCVNEDSVRESPCPGPDRQSGDTVQSLCVQLLQCCDSVFIPTVTRVCERRPSPQVLQLLFSILSLQFSLSPALMSTFANKLASSGFIRLAVEYQAVLCSGNRHASLNSACCDFLLKLCTCLLSQSDLVTSNHQQGVEEVMGVLQECLPTLCCRVCDWPLLLSDARAACQNTQYCLLHLMYLSLVHGDRVLDEVTVFFSVVRCVCVLQDQCVPLPPSALHSTLYLLAATHHSSPHLDQTAINSISRILSSSPLSSPHPSLLRFIFHYPELAERFGARVLVGWLEGGSEPGLTGEDGVSRGHSEQKSVLLELLETNPTIAPTLLKIMCDAEGAVAERAVGVLQRYLEAEQHCSPSLSALLRPALLQLLQKTTCDGSDSSTTRVSGCVCVVLEVLCMVQSQASDPGDMDSTDVRLLYHVSSLVGKMKCSNTEYLLPALNYIYFCLTTSSPHTTDRALSVLLCNTGVMEVLQTLLNVFQSSSSSLTPLSPSTPLLSCSLLLLSSIITHQHTHSTQVQKSVCLDLERIVRTLTFFRSNTDSLGLMCSVQLVQTMLDVDFSSAVVCVSECGLQRPLTPLDGALYPLGYSGTACLLSALQSLLLQKQGMLLSVSVNCLRSLLGFLHRRRPALVQHVVCQPWNRFLLYSLLSSGESLTLHPATLSLLTLLVRWSEGEIQWESDVSWVCEAAERRGLQELGEDTTHTLKLLLTECRAFFLSEHLKQTTDALLDTLCHLPPPETRTNTVVRVGVVYIRAADFSVNTQDHNISGALS